MGIGSPLVASNQFFVEQTIHHSSENLILRVVCANRFQVCQSFLLFLLIPAALLGSAKVIATLTTLFIYFYNFGIIPNILKIGFLENILVSPPHHRVHALNPEYMDKNHSQIFIFLG
jgi:sterol desaturase/sphingolipid hydroxylase (fatty acid hydroxylase superfamily)